MTSYQLCDHVLCVFLRAGGALNGFPQWHFSQILEKQQLGLIFEHYPAALFPCNNENFPVMKDSVYNGGKMKLVA